MSEKKPLSPEPLMKMATAFWLTQVLTVSVQLELFSKINSNINTIELLEKEAEIPKRPLEAMLAALVSMELLVYENGFYINSELSNSFLIKDKPSYFGDMILMQGTRLYNSWGKLYDSVNEDKPPRDLFENLKERTEDAKAFTKAMHNNSIGPAKALSEKVDLSMHKNLIDIGGGSGSYSITLTSKYDNLTAMVYEYETNCDVAKFFIEKAGLEDRVSVMPGDAISDELPKGFDVALLSQVIHSYSEDDCRDLLDKIYKALPENGLLIINEFFLGDDKHGPLFPALFSVNMLIESRQGRCYSTSEVMWWLSEIGFKNIQYDNLVGPVKFIKAFK